MYESVIFLGIDIKIESQLGRNRKSIGDSQTARHIYTEPMNKYPDSNHDDDVQYSQDYTAESALYTQVVSTMIPSITSPSVKLSFKRIY